MCYKPILKVLELCHKLSLLSTHVKWCSKAAIQNNNSLVVEVIDKGAITSKIKLSIKHKASPARLAQLLQPSLAFCFTLQPMTAYRPVLDGICRHWLQAKTKC